MAGTSGSDESNYVTAPACEGDHAPTSSLFLSALCDSILEDEKKMKKESGGGSGTDDSGCLEVRIERSKSHWSILSDQSGWSDDEVAEVAEVEVFKALQMHPTWRRFFATFGYLTEVYKSDGELVVGEKFAEGAQAKLYEAHVMWGTRNAKRNEEDVTKGRKYVLKVFKKGTFLKHLLFQLPHGFLKFRAEFWAFPTPKMFPRYIGGHC